MVGKYVELTGRTVRHAAHAVMLLNTVRGLHAAVNQGVCMCMQPLGPRPSEGVLQASLDNVVEGQHMLTSLSSGNIQ